MSETKKSGPVFVLQRSIVCHTATFTLPDGQEVRALIGHPNIAYLFSDKTVGVLDPEGEVRAHDPFDDKDVLVRMLVSIHRGERIVPAHLAAAVRSTGRKP